MAGANWVIRKSTLSGIGAACLAYAVMAESLNLELLSLPVPMEGALLRAGEFAVLWVILCSLVGWIMVVKNRPPAPDSHIWPIIVVPALIGSYLTLSETVESMRFLRFATDWRLYNPPIIAPALTMFVTILGCAILGIEAALWRRYAEQGICFECEHDLSGQTLNRCPQCGTQFDENSSYATHVSSRKYPELLLFVTAEQRRKGWAKVRRNVRVSPLNIGMWGIYAVVMILMPLALRTGYGLLLLFALFLLVVFFYAVRRKEHRDLRRELVAAGIPVCLKCGADLRGAPGGTCPKCGATVEGT